MTAAGLGSSDVAEDSVEAIVMMLWMRLEGTSTPAE
jgi:hypothetical protein